MKPFFWNLADWCVLAIIVWAHDMNTPIAERLLAAASVWVWIVNVLTVIYLLGLASFKEYRNQLQEQAQVRTKLESIHHWASNLANIAVFIYAGWVWSFSIRLLKLFITEIFNSKK